MPFFGFFRSTGTAKQPAEFSRSPQDLNRAAEEVYRAQAMGDEWDVVDDPQVETKAKALAEQARAEAARQEAERQRRLMELRVAQQKERERIAREERVQRMVATAATNLRTLAQTSSARWEAMVREHDQAQQAVDQIYLQATCWRCGQRGRLPIEDAELLASQPAPARPAGAHYEPVMQSARQLLQARKAALEAWRSYNDRRLPVERLRVESCFHPALADRFEQVRDCEVCGSLGMFHAAYFVGDFEAGGSQLSLWSRWRAAMVGYSFHVSPLIGFAKWVPVIDLNREQAKAWVRSYRQTGTSSDEWRAYEAELKEWNEKVAAGTIRPASNNDSIALIGRQNVGTHVEVSVADGKVTHTRKSEPVRPNARQRTLEWPDAAYWTNKYPAHWKGGPDQDLQIKPGVSYPLDRQDPLSKEPRLKPVRTPPGPAPTEALLLARKNFWASAP
ncbi:MAG: hypothetical protein AB7P37_07465 [Ramlibacter sp.]